MCRRTYVDARRTDNCPARAALKRRFASLVWITRYVPDASDFLPRPNIRATVNPFQMYVPHSVLRLIIPLQGPKKIHRKLGNSRLGALEGQIEGRVEWVTCGGVALLVEPGDLRRLNFDLHRNGRYHRFHTSTTLEYKAQDRHRLRIQTSFFFPRSLNALVVE